MRNNSVFVALLYLTTTAAEATSHCDPWVAKTTSVQGKVDVQYGGTKAWIAVQTGDQLCTGDKLRTAYHARSTLTLSNHSILSLDQNTTLILSGSKPKNISWILQLMQGTAFFRSREAQDLYIQTPFVNAVHKGTEFSVSVSSERTEIAVFDGVVSAQNAQHQLDIHTGSVGIAEKNLSLHQHALTITPQDAVQWALYYPPLIDVSANQGASSSHVQAAYTAYQHGNSDEAFTNLAEIPLGDQTPEVLRFHAGLLLSVGRVDEATSIIQRLEASKADPSTANALLAIIALSKNQQQQAFELANKAVSLDPNASVAQIALSYAYQSLFKIEAALQATQKATQLAQDNALAWARLAELQLSTGERDAALISAQKAQSLNPSLAKTQSIVGFANLAQTEIEAAQTAFTQAIKLDSSDPLARLGLGLVKIRKGDVATGTQELETAVNLDPNNALIRSYLGKAYYELRNKDFAGKEFEIAKAMDNKDPTPWFYDAILKQTTNRPVEALQDMQRAIELNDNRGVYRSKQLLDEDTAARTANLARIYNDLGFGRVALKEAWKSLGYDSTNPSAHRFLSDAYQGQPRYRIARASELLQAQLLQPINITPVQPQLTSENIGILNNTGSASLSSSEYDPLYTANGAHMVLNGAYGSNNTKTDNAIISGVYNKLSLSLGQFHYQTDGFRKNDDYQQNIYDAFAQYAFTPDFNLQAEFKNENVRAGDLPLRLNNVTRDNLRQSYEQNTARLGGHYKINTEQDIIASYFYTSRNDNFYNARRYDTDKKYYNNYDFTQLDHFNNEGHQTEIQYLFHPQHFELIAGFGYLNLKSNSLEHKNTLYFDQAFNDTNTKNQYQTDHFSGYVYSKQYLLPNLTSVLGISFDSLNKDLINYDSTFHKYNGVITHTSTTPLYERQQLNPKFGLIWNPFKHLTLRSAAFRTLNRHLVTNPTIEPTQIAGFNQFFDNNNDTSAWRYAFGLDYQPLKAVFIGGEISWRNAKQPFSENNGSSLQKQREALHLAYLYWTPVNWASLRTEYRLEKTSRDFTAGSGNDDLPQSVITHQVPISLNIFKTNGLFAKVTGTYVNQHVAIVTDEKKPPNLLKYQSEDFWTLDTSIGFRFPKKIGSINFEVRNLFDTKFKYQSNFDSSGPQLSPFIPERQFFIKLNLFF